MAEHFDGSGETLRDKTLASSGEFNKFHPPVLDAGAGKSPGERTAYRNLSTMNPLYREHATIESTPFRVPLRIINYVLTREYCYYRQDKEIEERLAFQEVFFPRGVH